VVQLHRLPHLLRRESVALADDFEKGLADLETPGIGKSAVLVLLKCGGRKLHGSGLLVRLLGDRIASGNLGLHLGLQRVDRASALRACLGALIVGCERAVVNVSCRAMDGEK